MPTDLPEPVAREIDRRRTKGEPFSPVTTTSARGPVATTFWGQAWCTNLEAYADYEHRLPGGRSLLRAGHVFDLELSPGFTFAYVADTELFEVETHIAPLADTRWSTLKQSLTGKITNLLSLLSGQLDDTTLEALTTPETGLFPAPSKITINCNCPDHAGLCTHGAAALYAIATRFDHDPALFFKLRGVDHTELVTAATSSAASLTDPTTTSPKSTHLTPSTLSTLFNIDLADPDSAFPDIDPN